MQFARQICWHSIHQKRQEVFDEINQLAFEKFKEGEFTLGNPQNQEKALWISGLSDEELIKNLYSEDHFTEHFCFLELHYRDLFDMHLYNLGCYGNSPAREQAIELMLSMIDK